MLQLYNSSCSHVQRVAEKVSRFRLRNFDSYSDGEVVISGVIGYSQAPSWMGLKNSRPQGYLLVSSGIVFSDFFAQFPCGLRVDIVRDVHGFHARNSKSLEVLWRSYSLIPLQHSHAKAENSFGDWGDCFPASLA